jgi:hypothetical protein
VLAAACLVWLAGCETTSTSDNPFMKRADGDTTGSILAPTTPPGLPPANPELLGADPNLRS